MAHNVVCGWHGVVILKYNFLILLKVYNAKDYL